MREFVGAAEIRRDEDSGEWIVHCPVLPHLGRDSASIDYHSRRLEAAVQKAAKGHICWDNKRRKEKEKDDGKNF